MLTRSMVEKATWLVIGKLTVDNGAVFHIALTQICPSGEPQELRNRSLVGSIKLTRR